MIIEKAPGWDWAVTFEWEDGGQDVMSVFGCIMIEEAIKEARYSLDAGGLGYSILATERQSD